jgi:hypothetical protein
MYVIFFSTTLKVDKQIYIFDYIFFYYNNVFNLAIFTYLRKLDKSL